MATRPLLSTALCALLFPDLLHGRHPMASCGTDLFLPQIHSGPPEFFKMWQLKGEVGVVSRADGSALFEMGNTRVIAAVYGPREVRPCPSCKIQCKDEPDGSPAPSWPPASSTAPSSSRATSPPRSAAGAASASRISDRGCPTAVNDAERKQDLVGSSDMLVHVHGLLQPIWLVHVHGLLQPICKIFLARGLKEDAFISCRFLWRRLPTLPMLRSSRSGTRRVHGLEEQQQGRGSEVFGTSPLPQIGSVID